MEETCSGGRSDFWVGEVLETKKELVVALDAVGGGRRDRIERVGENGQTPQCPSLGME